MEQHDRRQDDEVARPSSRSLLSPHAVGLRVVIGLTFGSFLGVFSFPFVGELTLRRFVMGVGLSALFGAIFAVVLPLVGAPRRPRLYSLVIIHLVAAFAGGIVATLWWFLSTPDVSLLTAQLVGALIGMVLIHGP